MYAMYCIYERFLPLHGPIATGNLWGLTCRHDEREAAAVPRHNPQTRAMHTLPRDMHASLSQRAVPQFLQLQQNPLAVQAGRDSKVIGQSSQRVFV